MLDHGCTTHIPLIWIFYKILDLLFYEHYFTGTATRDRVTTKEVSGCGIITLGGTKQLYESSHLPLKLSVQEQEMFATHLCFCLHLPSNPRKNVDTMSQWYDEQPRQISSKSNYSH